MSLIKKQEGVLTLDHPSSEKANNFRKVKRSMKIQPKSRFVKWPCRFPRQYNPVTLVLVLCSLLVGIINFKNHEGRTHYFWLKRKWAPCSIYVWILLSLWDHMQRIQHHVSSLSVFWSGEKPQVRVKGSLSDTLAAKFVGVCVTYIYALFWVQFLAVFWSQRLERFHLLLVQDGMTWLLNPPEQNLPLILADNGFDVWIANARGTRFSRQHTSLDATQPVLSSLLSCSLLFWFVYHFDFLCKLSHDRSTGIGHGMNWWPMICQPFSIIYTTKQGKKLITLGIHW